MGLPIVFSNADIDQQATAQHAGKSSPAPAGGPITFSMSDVDQAATARDSAPPVQQTPPAKPSLFDSFSVGTARGMGLDTGKIQSAYQNGGGVTGQVGEVGRQVVGGLSTWLGKVAQDPFHVVDPLHAIASGLEDGVKAVHKTWADPQSTPEQKSQALGQLLGATSQFAAGIDDAGGVSDIARQARSTVGDLANKIVEKASGVPDVVKQVVKGEEYAQAPAKAALAEGAVTSAADAGVADATEGTAAPAGEVTPIRSLMEKPIADAAKAEGELYDRVNTAAQTDLKDLYDRREELTDTLSDPTQISNKTALQAELKTNASQIAEGEANVHEALGEDGPALIDQAKQATQQRYSMEELDRKLFNSEGVVEGNAAHGDPETINIKSAIRQVENLDKTSKFAPRGTPSRLKQALGVDGAAKLKQSLYDAKAAGKTALRTQQVAKLLGVAGGAALGFHYGGLGGAALGLLAERETGILGRGKR